MGTSATNDVDLRLSGSFQLSRLCAPLHVKEEHGHCSILCTRSGSICYRIHTSIQRIAKLPEPGLCVDACVNAHLSLFQCELWTTCRCAFLQLTPFKARKQTI